ncbi:ATP-binding protein [Candidatus Borrarchaeum sp.]|uniref:ATP-binding protein n=1 Tax=Candidatus Borrarchaeum sp. TaxID=2846742 RepID=UPI00257E18F9|nr:ATP-binding protein [Candidatus Borrarchaeum sp.]
MKALPQTGGIQISWIHEFFEKYRAQITPLSITHFNIEDFPQLFTAKVNGKTLPGYFEFVIEYDIGSGLCPFEPQKTDSEQLTTDEDSSEQITMTDKLCQEYAKFIQSDEVYELPVDPVETLNFIRYLFREYKGLFVLYDCETIAPDSSAAHMTLQDRQCSQLLKNLALDHKIRKKGSAIIVTAERLEDIAQKVRKVANIIEIPLPDDTSRKKVFEQATEKVAYNPKDLDQWVVGSKGLTIKELKSIIVELYQKDTTIMLGDFYDQKAKKLEKYDMVSLENPKFGFEGLVLPDYLSTFLKTFIIKPYQQAMQIRPKGILFTGPPGTGKSVLAEVIAYELNRPLITVDASNLLSQYVGESEKRTAQFFRVIRQFGEAVVLIDEAEELLSERSTAVNTDSGVTSNLKATFLHEMARDHGVLFILNTNYPMKLDAAMVRVGRINYKIPLLPPFTAEERAKILRVVLDVQLKVPYDKNIDFEAIAATLQGYTGAELRELASVAWAIACVENDKEKTEQEDFDVAKTVFLPDTRKIKEMTADALSVVNDKRLLPPQLHKEKEKKVQEFQEGTWDSLFQ